MVIEAKDILPRFKDGKESGCIKCQHCLAVCPTASLSICGVDPNNSITATEPIAAPKELENLMMMRRSVRRYQNKEVDKNLIAHIANRALYAPTGHNSKQVKITVVDSREQLNKLRDMVYDKLSKTESLPSKYAFLANFSKLWFSKGVDIIFRDAPHIAFFSASRSAHFPEVDATIAATYFDTLAVSYRLGTLWSGMNIYVFEDVVPDLKSVLGVPDNYKVVAAINFGYSAVKYLHSVQHDNANVEIVNL